MDIQKLKTNKTAERSGVWVRFDDETELLIAANINGSMTPEYRKALGDEVDALRKQKKALQPEDYDLATLRTYAKAVLLGWKGIKDGESDFLYSTENSVFLLENVHAIRRFVFAYADNENNFTAARLEEAKATLGKS